MQHLRNQENAQNSPDPFLREGWGLRTRLQLQGLPFKVHGQQYPPPPFPIYQALLKKVSSITKLILSVACFKLLTYCQ